MTLPNDMFSTNYGVFSKRKLSALLDIRAVAIESIRRALRRRHFEEVTTATIVNIAGSCENPNASFPIDYYGKQAYLAQSAQLQLEPLVLALRRSVFTIATSFRAENYDDPESAGRRLSEFTLIEVEAPYGKYPPKRALSQLLGLIERVIKSSVRGVLSTHADKVRLLGGNVTYLRNLLKVQFNRIDWENARDILASTSTKQPLIDFGISEEKALLKYFRNTPTFVLMHPPQVKFFNLLRTATGDRSYSVDLLLPPLGETVGGALRESNPAKIRRQLMDSRVGQYLMARKISPDGPFALYLNLIEREKKMLRGGFGLGFERFVSFLINSNDILKTVSYEVLSPSGHGHKTKPLHAASKPLGK